MTRMSNLSKESPNVFRYLNYRTFMTDFYESKRSQDPNFSHTTWCLKAGFRSRSQLRLIMQGRRDLTAPALPLVVKALELTKTKAKFFELLVQYDQAQTLEERDFYLKQIFKHTPEEEKPKVDAYRYLMSWHVPQAFVYLGLNSVERTAEGLAKALNLSLPETEEIIDCLLRLKLIEKHEQTLIAVDHDVVVPDQTAHLAVQMFHRKSLQKAIEAITFPQNVRFAMN